MKFYICRTSDWGINTDKPCDEAVKDEKGRWVINFDTLEELAEFTADECCIIEGNDLEIYDDYRE